MDQNIAEIDKICQEFNSTIIRLLNIFKKLDPSNADLNFLQRQVSLARDIDPLLLINGAKDPLWDFREEILAEKDEFFLNTDYSKYIEGNGNDQEDFI